MPKTHYLFSAGKDRSVKYWDADKFEPLLTLSGHHAAVWCVAVSARGNFVVNSKPKILNPTPKTLNNKP